MQRRSNSTDLKIETWHVRCICLFYEDITKYIRVSIVTNYEDGVENERKLFISLPDLSSHPLPYYNEVLNNLRIQTRYHAILR
jgi:hypothetical protein